MLTANGNYSGTILVVDDEPNAVRVLSAILAGEGYNVLEAMNADSAIKILGSNDIDTVITDLKMPDKDGMYIFDHIQDNLPDIPVIFLTAYGTVESAVNAMILKAYYYFIKPPDYEKLKGMLAKAVKQRRLKRELDILKQRLVMGNNDHSLIGNSAEMRKILETVEAIKDSASSVLINGDTGTGKELIARSLHFSGKRRDKPFIAVNCAAIPRELIESELFGYEKGAFTGATTRRKGKFEEASGGTVFLDEIGELEMPLQSKLLRVLQEREIVRLGSNKGIRVDFRLISSTNRDLQAEVNDGNFREDLFYRINVVQIKVPPLRERKEDIPLLVSEFVKELCIKENKAITFSDEVLNIFRDYDWPGNIRQLRNVVERAIVLTKGSKITRRELTEELAMFRKSSNSEGSTITLREMEGQAIIKALQESMGNKSKAAHALGISRKAFYKKLKELEL